MMHEQITDIRYGQLGSILFNFSGHTVTIKEPTDVLLVGYDKAAAKWILKPSENLKDYNARIEAAQKKAARARGAYQIDCALSNASELHEEASRYAVAFRLSPNSIVSIGNVDEVKAAVKAAEQREREAKKKRTAKVMKEAGPLLRIQGEQIETSMGARFPLSHAKRGLALVRAVKASGKEWRTNGHSCHLGHYQIDRIEPSGTVHAGCHVVRYAEIERLAPQIEAA